MNPSTLWSRIFVDELARNGLQAVVIAPGSRSTPLAIAFSQEPRIKVYSLIDERSAAFFALGIGLATGQPAAVLCTSGTAVANFHPAVIEAYYAHIPLLLLTADRPPELRESGANQTINQVNIYGSHVRWFVDVTPPETAPADLTLRYLRTTACRAMNTAVSHPSGPVHLNFPFRKPLEPLPTEPVDLTKTSVGLNGRSHHLPFTTFSQGTMQPTTAQIDTVRQAIQAAPHGLIICGPRCPGGEFPQAVVQLAKAAGYPILADATSGLRFGHHLDETVVLGGYNSYLPAWEHPPDLLLRFGAMPTTKALLDFVENLPHAQHIAINPNGVWEDASHQLTQFITADPTLLCHSLSSFLSPLSSWLALWQTAESAAWEAIAHRRQDGFFEGAILADVVEALPENATLFVSSSLPVRYLDQLARPAPKRLHIFANRGTSGIDGTISSALGVAVVQQPVVLVTGDLAFYHDMNGLLALKRCGVHATIVLINNNGGGIFRRLPVSQFEPPFTDLFLTPHDLPFEPAAQLYGVAYTLVSSLAELREKVQESVETAVSHIIEIQTT